MIRDDVIDVLGLRSSPGPGLSHIVKMRVDDFTLKIYVDTAGLFDHAKTTSDDRAQAKSDWSRKVAGLRMKLPEGVTNVLVQVGDPDHVYDIRSMVSLDDIVDGDDVDENPNFPSRTGNPSGGGRGNNPPRR